MFQENELHEHTPVMPFYVPAKFRVQARRKARHVRTAQTVLKTDTIPLESTCRAFRGIFHYFRVVYVDMHHLMRIYAFQRGKLHACDVRERRSAELGGLAAQPPSDSTRLNEDLVR